MAERVDSIRTLLRKHDQEHLLAFFDELPPPRRRALLDRIESIDLDDVAPLIEDAIRGEVGPSLPPDLEPAPFYPHDPENHHRTYDGEKYIKAGEELVRSGKLAAFTVAGGQGTRLGWNGPKGTFPATVVTGKPLFRVFAEQIRANQERYGVRIPWYIMTSPINDAPTRAFFADNNCFGLDRRNIFMFPQGVMPSFDRDTGKILLAEKDEVAVNPDGHGGSFRALERSGALADMVARGIEHISYFQVDNPLVKIVDPVFIGLHAEAPDSSGEMSSKMVPKAGPGEKVGVLCASGGTTVVIEYSDLSENLANERDEQGHLRFLAGNVAIHLIGVDFVERLTASGRLDLPWHRAVKKVPHVDPATGERVEPAEPNAIKLEAFVFDALPKAKKSLVYETSRVEEFAPIKNRDGVDSAATSHQLQSERNARWLEACGVMISRDDEGRAESRIEISPLTALKAEDLKSLDLPEQVREGEEIVL